MFGGSDYQIIESHEIDGYAVMRRRWSPGYEQWRCDCAEYLTIKPRTLKAWCQHWERAVTVNSLPRDSL